MKSEIPIHIYQAKPDKKMDNAKYEINDPWSTRHSQTMLEGGHNLHQQYDSEIHDNIKKNA